MQPALQCALSNSLSTVAVVVHEHLSKPLSTHYNGNFDDEPEFRSLEPPLQSLQPAGNFEVSGGVMDGFPPTCPVLSTHPLCCASPGTLFATVHRTDSLTYLASWTMYTHLRTYKRMYVCMYVCI